MDERFEIFTDNNKWAIKDNEQLPHLLDSYKCCVRLNQQDTRIKELESEVNVGEFWHSAYQGKQLEYDMVYAELRKAMDENEQLKQQLAEQEKEIATLEVMLAENKNELKELQEFKVGDDAYDLTDSDARFSLHCDLLNMEQDKISFALEQLENVKNKIESKVESIYKILDDLNIRIVDECTSRQLSSYEEIVKDIDNQIKELKEMDNV